MNTSELLVYVFVFLVGYMLFKRCGCRSVEGVEVPKVETCYLDDNIWKYVDQDKLTALNKGYFLTTHQCTGLQGLNSYSDKKKCETIGNHLYFDRDLSNMDTCKYVCPEDMYWSTDRSDSKCFRNPVSSPTPT